MTEWRDPIVLVAHGSRDPHAAAATRALVRAVAAQRPGVDVRAAYLDHTLPRPVQVLAALDAAGHRHATVVPLLLTAAYHGRVDVPAAVTAARAEGLRMALSVSDVLGPVGGRVDPLLLDGLCRRLREAAPQPGAGTPAPGEVGLSPAGPGEVGLSPAGPGEVGAWSDPTDRGFDAVVLAAAGTRDARARATVGLAARQLGARLGVPCTVAYASAGPPSGAAAVRRLRSAGAQRVAVAAYFLAPGLLYDTVTASARSAGAVRVAAPLHGAAQIARLVLARVDAARLGGVTLPAAA